MVLANSLMQEVTHSNGSLYKLHPKYQDSPYNSKQRIHTSRKSHAVISKLISRFCSCLTEPKTGCSHTRLLSADEHNFAIAIAAGHSQYVIN